jgi:uncharacterized membrane protein YccF (DUF307 family)
MPDRPVDRPASSWVLAGTFGVLYLATCARVVQGGDSPEFLTVAAAGGVAHPSGYPLFSLAARAFVLGLPFGTVAWKVSALSALLAAATLGVLHRAVLRLTGDGVAALTAATALGFSVLFWRWSVVPEVLSGSTLTVALVVLAATRIAQGAEGPRAGLFLGLAFATGIAHHHTAILLAPLLIWAWVAAWPRPWTPAGIAGTTAAAAAGALVGLLPYLTLMVPGGAWRWGDTESFSGLVHHFLRRDYGTFATGQADRGIAWWVQPRLYLEGIGRQLMGLPALLGVVGFGAALVQTDDRRKRGFAAALLAAWLVAGPLFVSRFDLPPEGYYRVVVERFHSFPTTLYCVAVGLGSAWFLKLKLWSRPALPIALLALNLAVAGLLAAPRASMRDATILDDFLRNTLGALEPDAVLFTQGDSFNFGCMYAREGLGLRPDVACIHGPMVGHEWYRERLLARHPDLVLTLDGAPMRLPELVTANAAIRPVYLSSRIPLLAPEVVGIIPPTWPAAGTLLRVSGPGEYPPPPGVVEAALVKDWEGFVLNSRLVDAAELDESLESTAWDHYAQVWIVLATGFDAVGDAAGSARCRARARDLSPWLLGAE